MAAQVKRFPTKTPATDLHDPLAVANIHTDLLRPKAPPRLTRSDLVGAPLLL